MMTTTTKESNIYWLSFWMIINYDWTCTLLPGDARAAAASNGQVFKGKKRVLPTFVIGS